MQIDVIDELGWEPSVDAAAIGVTAHDGVVTLNGNVRSFAEKVAAGDAAERVLGVRAIANDIEVRPVGTGQRTDADIAAAAADAIAWRTTVPDERVKVAVTKGYITLDGEVDWHFQRASAEDAVRHLLGVRGVINNIAVTPRASVEDVKSRIDAALRRSAELDAKRIRVESHEGKVVLRGDVPTWNERQEAERTAWAAPGVTRVENFITITPRLL
ncbi:MAG TPA: BON domain-containing protein [Isosphaeraceae bacterium]|nr:BON domain-containing protein [Isosphaeraceae bacterium]